MPLVDPVTMGKGENLTDTWMSKLMGKKLDDKHSETVCATLAFFAHAPSAVRHGPLTMFN